MNYGNPSHYHEERLWAKKGFSVVGEDGVGFSYKITRYKVDKGRAKFNKLLLKRRKLKEQLEEIERDLLLAHNSLEVIRQWKTTSIE